LKARIIKILRFFKKRSYEKELLENLKPLNNIFKGRVIIDGTFDNPNFWYRLIMTIRSIGFVDEQLIGILGPHNRFTCKNSLKNIGVSEFVDLVPNDEELDINKKIASSILTEVKTDKDFLDFKFPYNFPSEFVYDHILKKQRGAEIDFKHPKLVDDIGYVLAALNKSFKMFEEYKPELIVMAHCVGWYAAVTWAAICNGKESIVLFGDTGLSRFWRIKKKEDLFSFVDCASPELFKKYIENKGVKERLSEKGEVEIQGRFQCRTSNLGSYYAFKKRDQKVTRREICENNNWDSKKTIVSVFSSNWFDFPHTYGMKNFLNFKDWIDLTLEIAKERKDINWIFKGHPVDEWYGGVTLEDLVSVSGAENITFANKTWNGVALMDAVDGIVTCHGTVGIEAPSRGIPVLNADKSFYEKLGFTTASSSREEYVRNLKSDWWKNLEVGDMKEKSKIFAGTYWGKTSWQKKLILDDDSEMWKLYKTNKRIFRECYNSEIKLEMNSIRDWFYSDFSHLNTYKLYRDLYSN